MKPLGFRPTTAAKIELLRFMERIKDYRPGVCVTWRISGSRGWIGPNGNDVIHELGSGWDVGFYDIEKLPAEELCEIDGFTFVFDTGPQYPRLRDATLDYSTHGFVVIESAAKSGTPR